MGNIGFESEKSMKEISLFIEEINQFYFLIFKRLKEYEKIEQFDKDHQKFLSCVYFDLNEDYNFYLEKLNSIFESYSNLHEHSIFRCFIQTKREFYIFQIEKWKNFWNNLKLDLKLNKFGFKSNENLILISQEFNSLNKFEINEENKEKTNLKLRISELEEKIIENEEIYPSLKNSILVKIDHQSKDNVQEKEFEDYLFFDSIGKEI